MKEEPIHQMVVSVPSELKIAHGDQSAKTHHQLVNNLRVSNDEFSKTRRLDDDNNKKKEAAIHGPSSTTSGGGEDVTGRERLKRHRIEMAGRTWIPDIWGQEELLKDWIDCTKFDDASLVTNNVIMSARAALVQEGRRANSSRFRIENRC
ncbi:uncharacterized protein LOC132293290 [Cornus florida]|uniref:uncharacterized protein LOC132293290 n=1 Tax=Cornus florida TaxID=4283 RepID=UPI0028A15DB5|nr:uncharacterized protein LOC132293290 [Cornus florida]